MLLIFVLKLIGFNLLKWKYISNHTERIGLNHCGEIAERNHWMY